MKEQIEKHPVVYFMGAIVTAFGIGFSASEKLHMSNQSTPQKLIFEEIQKTEKLLSLQRELEKDGRSIESLKALETRLLEKSGAAKAIGEAYLTRAESVRSSALDKAMTQDEMNQIAEREFKSNDELLIQVITELKRYYSPAEISRFDELQRTWLEYRQQNADFWASQYEGGTIKPLIYFSDLDSTTTARVIELQGTLEQLKATIVPYAERNLSSFSVRRTDYGVY